MTDSDPSDLNITDIQTGAQFTITADELHTYDITGVVPIEALEELVDTWNEAEATPTSYRDSLARAADELQELIEDYE